MMCTVNDETFTWNKMAPENFVWNKVSFIGVLASNLGLESTISIYTSDFSQNKWPKFAKQKEGKRKRMKSLHEFWISLLFSSNPKEKEK
jgi:hypothetical protein